MTTLNSSHFGKLNENHRRTRTVNITEAVVDRDVVTEGTEEVVLFENSYTPVGTETN